MIHPSLKSRVPMRRTPMPAPRKPIRKVSKRKARENRELSKTRTADLTPWTECEYPECEVPAVDWHHRKKRGRGGSNARCNRVWFCRPHHDFVERNEVIAHEMGLSRKSWEDE